MSSVTGPSRVRVSQQGRRGFRAVFNTLGPGLNADTAAGCVEWINSRATGLAKRQKRSQSTLEWLTTD